MTHRPAEVAAYGVHWFRRDLRVAGNPALQWSFREHEGRVLGLFMFDRKFLAREDFSANRFGFFLATLRALRDELRSVGGDLLVLDVGPRDALGKLFQTLHKHKLPLPAAVSFNRDYEPFARKRDADISNWLTGECQVLVHTEADHLLVEPDAFAESKTKFYQVFTPFSRRWHDELQTPELRKRIAAQKPGLTYLNKLAKGTQQELFKLTWKDLFGGKVSLPDALESTIEENKKQVTVPLPEAGSLAAIARLRTFKKQGLGEYAERRDLPAVQGTSQLSIYLKNGSLTTAQIMALLDNVDQPLDVRDGPATFVKELAWREFYYHVLYHRPEVEHAAHQEKYRDITWENREDFFAAWYQGRTGYPIVDAGMRQLNATGWMHNRVRMIVASFLTKDLLIDWRWGERYFMQQLLDGDLAPNNGGWQWAASTGCDAQPYFRIFSPKLQSEKFDPHGEYIRRWVPELSELSAKQIHEPHAAGIQLDYPRPIVDHQEQKPKALALYTGGKD